MLPADCMPYVARRGPDLPATEAPARGLAVKTTADALAARGRECFGLGYNAPLHGEITG